MHDRLQLLSLEPSTLGPRLTDLGFRISISDHTRDLDADVLTIVDGRHFDANAGAAIRGPYFTIQPNRTRANVRAWVDAGARDVADWSCSPRELAVRTTAAIRDKTKIACIGGGTGLFHLLLGLKVHRDVQLTSIVAMSDDGGSSGRLRAECGVLPPGDIRRSLVALSDAPTLMNDVVQFRFNNGKGIAGHSLGNLVLTALTDLCGSFEAGVRALADILHIRGIVTCVTTASTKLCAEMEDGSIVRGESQIDRSEGRDKRLRIRRVWLEPSAPCSLDAYLAIATADLVLIGPGDLYTSVIANLVVDGMADALAHTKARLIYIANLMTKPGETPGYSAADHVRALIEHLGIDRLDDVITSNTTLAPEAIARYAAQDQHPVGGAVSQATRARLIEADVSDPEHLVRHDSPKLAEAILALRPPRGTATVDIRPRTTRRSIDTHQAP